MTIVSAFVLYNCFWWLTFFAVLPMGYNPQTKINPGHDLGAPEKPYMGRKLILTTGIATLLWIVALVIIQLGWFTLESFSYFNRVVPSYFVKS